LGISPRKFGLVIMVAGPASGAAYAFTLAEFGVLALEGTALAVAFLFIAITTWIGYTMLTEPPTARPTTSDIDSEDLASETINPRPGAELSGGSISRFSVAEGCSIGEGTVIRDQVNLYRCKIGRDCKIESFVYIEEGVVIGNRCKIKPNVFIPTGVMIEDDVFIGPNATFTNDKHPRVSGDWKLLETRVGRGASVGANAVILPGIKIGPNSIVGAGAVVTKDVPEGSVVVGNPARVMAKTIVLEGPVM
jgi:acetyltransferase-like isoleucine patch superfamily enzyme